MNDKIKMALVGLVFGRYIVEDQIPRGPGSQYIEIVGVCDLDKELAASVAGRNGFRNYESLDAILADPEVEAVGLFTGPFGRANLIRKIIRAGKHVMTTKPFELDANAALSVLREAQDLKRAVHLNSPASLVEPENQQILDWVEEFNLGRAVSFHWETHGNYTEEPDGSWYDDSEKCPAAPAFRLGIYAINQFIRLHGPVESVSVLSNRIRTRRPTADNALLSLRFRNGVLGSIQASFCVHNGFSYADDLVINYERGTIRSEAIDRDQHGMPGKHMWLQTVGKNGAVLKREACFGRDEKVGGYNWAAFHQAVRSGGILEGTIEPVQVAAGVQVIAAMADAEKTGRSIRIDDLR